MSAERLRVAADRIDRLWDDVGWEPWERRTFGALAAWMRLEADIITARGDKYAVDISGDHALGVAEAILGGAS